MKPERWKQIERLYDAAQKLDLNRRAAFLDQACEGDDELRQEVSSLLASDEQAGDFLAASALEVAAKGLAATGDSSRVGRRVGHYHVLSLLGAGGMGEVYLARDTRLDRNVAIKFLPAVFAQDLDHLRRFEQEARATSATNHPNILTVYDIGAHEGLPYIVAESLEGAELRAQLDQGALPVGKAVSYAQQVAHGLAAAHEKGVVHRDLKPENLFITTDDRVKILDFGLAKLKPQTGGPVDSQAVTQKNITDPGTVMGTAGYMAPEQARGQDVDHRADIFAFGVILYEMLSGRRPFTGDSAVDVMSAILKEEPPKLAGTNAKISPQLELIALRCLEKKPERRFQSASDLGFALESLSMPSGAAVTSAAIELEAPKRGGWRERLAWIAAGVIALAGLALGVGYLKRSTMEPRALRLAFAPPENVAFDNGLFDYVIVSPDGQKLAFTGRSADGKRQLWVRPIDSTEAQPLPGTEDPLQPFWSPDSHSIGFGSQGKLKRIDLGSSLPQTLCDASRFLGGTWSRAGVILFTPNMIDGLFQIPATGGEPRQVTIPDLTRELGHRNPYFLPDGRHFLYQVDERNREQRVFAGSIDSKEVKQVLTDGGPAVYAAPGWLLFVKNGALQAQGFDAAQLELKGEVFAFTRPTNIPSLRGIPFSVSENGALIWQGDRLREYQLLWFDREGKQVGAVGAPMKVFDGQSPSLAPDGKRVAIHRSDFQTRNTDIWAIDLAHDIPTRLTSDPAVESNPIWSPDGGRMVFFSNKRNGLYQKATSGAGTEELLLEGSITPSDWSLDGRFIIYSQNVEKTRRDIWALPLTGARRPYPLLDSAFDEYRGQLSPAGDYLAYVSDESGSFEIYVQPFTADGKLGADKYRISTGGGNQPRWRRDGRELFYIAPDGQMMAVAVKTNGAAFDRGAPKALFKTRAQTWMTQPGIEYGVTADGQRFLIGSIVSEAAPVSVIFNWTAEAQR
jgi:Tol biopolymer transport system component